MNKDFKRKVEEASLNAWPALNQIFLDGWILRFSKGYTKRANSVNPLYLTYHDYKTKIKRCESLYKKNSLPTIFRLTSFSESTDLDNELSRLNYQYLDKTSVMLLDLPKDFSEPSGRTIFKEETLETWMEIFAYIGRDQRNKNQVVHQDILERILAQTIFSSLAFENKYVSCGLGIMEDELLGIFDLITDPACRRKGYGEELMNRLLALGYERGARQAYLQVVYSNQTAIQLYKKLGFKELYHYWYRMKK